jgi:ABC-type sugar transport system substrate-binding protein
MKSLAAVAAMVGALVTLTACGDDDSSSSGSKVSQKTLILALSFPCGFNDYSKDLCQGAKDAGAKLSDKYKVDIKTGVNIGDTVAYGNLIKSALQLKPAGMVVFPLGPSATSAAINKACDADVKLVVVDNAPEGVSCPHPFFGSDPTAMGKLAAEWLAKNVDKGTKVGTVSAPPSQSVDLARVKGFVAAAKAAGLVIAQSVTTAANLDGARKVAANMLTAHPDLRAVFSADGVLGPGVVKAVDAAGKQNLVYVQVDAFKSVAPQILKGTVGAMIGQNAYQYGFQAIEALAKLDEGESVPDTNVIPGKVIDKSNAQEFIDAGGLR